MSENPFKIGITQGDINGISYEVILKALSDNKITELCTPIIYGIAKVASFHKSKLDMQESTIQVIKKLEQVNLKKSNLLNLVEQEVKVDLGTSTETAGKMAELSLNSACNDLKNKKIDAIVTAPINKANIQSATFKFNGHTEYLASQFDAKDATFVIAVEISSTFDAVFAAKLEYTSLIFCALVSLISILKPRRAFVILSVASAASSPAIRAIFKVSFETSITWLVFRPC